MDAFSILIQPVQHHLTPLPIASLRVDLRAPSYTSIIIVAVRPTKDAGGIDGNERSTG